MGETISVRGLADGTLDKIDAHAALAGKNREAWVREQIEQLVSGPIPIAREQYAYRVYGRSGKGTLRRLGNHPNATGATFSDFNQEEADAVKRAENLMRRNAPGDLNKALEILYQQFGPDSVFEAPV